MNDPATGKPFIFHSMWRTSSTYFFSLFRQEKEFLTFYEPFNEALVSLDTALGQPDEAAHPDLGRHYFDEYRYVTDGDRIRHFDLNFAYLQYLWFDFDTRCKAYVDHLIRTAWSHRKRPFLQFNRTYLCLDHFRNFQNHALNVYFYRHPRHQFWSYGNAGRSYYLGLSYLQFACESHRSESAALRHVNIPFYYSQTDFRHTLGFYRAFTELSTTTSYYVFFSLWCLGLLNAVRLDLPCVSVDRESSPSAPDDGVLDFFARECPDMDLGDFAPKSHDQVEGQTELFAAIEKLVLSHLDDSVDRQHMDGLRARLTALELLPEACGDPEHELLRQIREETRRATNANFASIAGGLQLGANVRS